MILSHRHRFIFLKTRKTGGTSVEIALSAVCGRDDILTPIDTKDEEFRIGNGARNFAIPFAQRTILGMARSALGVPHNNDLAFRTHMTARQVRRHIGRAVWKEYFKFTIERNPWDRLVSLYHYLYRNSDSPPGFDSFLERIVNSRRSHNFDIYSIAGQPAVDFVMRYDRLGEEFRKVMQRLAIEDAPILQHANASNRQAEGWRGYYNERTREFVRLAYAREIEAFGFEF